MNPSTDIIDVLGGLDSIDKLVSDLVNTLESIIRSSPNLDLRSKAITTSMVMVAGAFQTSLVSYFTHRDVFPALMRYVHDVPDLAYQSYILLGSLASYNKFEQQNVYQNRLEDFVDESSIRLLIDSFAETCRSIRSDYTSIHDDSAPVLTLSSALSYVGLRSLSPDARKPPPPSEEEAKQLFNALPSPLASTLLPTYTFVSANKIFASALLSTPSGPSTTETPLASFLGSTSYLCHHAHRSQRGSTYANFSLLIIRLLFEDPMTARPICHATAQALPFVRLARQRAPFLPLPQPSLAHPRPPAAIILDIATDTLSHNLRRRLDISLYSLALSLIVRVLTTLSPNPRTITHTGPNIRLAYHWSHLWSTLLSLVKFTTTYATDLQSLRGYIKDEVVTPIADILAFSLTRGDVFLPGEAEFDDLFYKLVEGYEVLSKFNDAWTSSATSSSVVDRSPALPSSTGKPNRTASAGTPRPRGRFERATSILLAVAGHYHGLLTSSLKSRKHQSASEVKRVIKDEGYEGVSGGLSISTGSAAAGGLSPALGATEGTSAAMEDGFGNWTPWREVEHKAEVKRLVRGAMEDVRVLGLR